MKKIILIIMVLSMVVLSGCTDNNTCEYETEFREVTDILQVSAGGYSSSDKCIVMTNEGKLSLSGDKICKVQIDDIISKNFNINHCPFMYIDYWKIA